MDVEIIEDKENPLLRRRDVKFKVSYQGPTPNRQDVRGKLMAMLNSDKELTVLERLKSNYGSQTALGSVRVYADKEALKIEPEYVIKRNFGVKEEKAEAPAKDDGKTEPAPDKKAPEPKEGE